MVFLKFIKGLKVNFWTNCAFPLKMKLSCIRKKRSKMFQVKDQLTDFYMLRGFTERYFLTDYSYILENHFYFVNVPDYCFKPSLSRIFCVNSSVKLLSPQYGDLSTHIFRTSSLCTFINYRKKEIGRFRC